MQVQQRREDLAIEKKREEKHGGGKETSLVFTRWNFLWILQYEIQKRKALRKRCAKLYCIYCVPPPPINGICSNDHGIWDCVLKAFISGCHLFIGVNFMILCYLFHGTLNSFNNEKIEKICRRFSGVKSCTIKWSKTTERQFCKVCPWTNAGLQRLYEWHLE